MYFNQLTFFLSLFVCFSCATRFEKAMKSGDRELIVEAAKKYYNKGRYEESVLLYEKAGTLSTEVSQTKDITYKTAEANMAAENYLTASHQFNVYHVNYSSSPLAQEALFQSAVCLYKISPEYNLDPTHTQEAINKFQSFADTYPDSEKLPEVNKKIEELRKKLEQKSYELAKLFFKIENFKSSSVAFKNFLNDFPDTKNKEESMYLICKSDYNLFIKSINQKKEERAKEALFSFKNFDNAFPQSNYQKELKELKENLIKEQKQITTL